MDRAVCLAGEAVGDAVALGEAEDGVEFLGIICAVSGMEKARLATQRMAARLLSFLIISWIVVG
ncbi:MAG: hypothetical protein DME75_00455 [Verrucomicrobia bacterium]|nr:MAG: hypothetical protein DME75_00455 [Verrucomicrobiota bacterium]HXL26797.1 hypothetical protein [Chthoniobacterales bacterium]